MSDSDRQKGRGVLNLTPFEPGNTHGKANSKYMASYDDIARRFYLLRKNATDADLAQLLGVAESTVYLWKKEHPTFSEAIRAGKEMADLEVAESLNFSAVGGMVFETQAVKLKDFDPDTGKARGERIEIVETKRYIPPDFQAQRLWLTNRHGADWREKFAPSEQPKTVTNITIGKVEISERAQATRDELGGLLQNALSGKPSERTRRDN